MLAHILKQAPNTVRPALQSLRNHSTINHKPETTEKIIKGATALITIASGSVALSGSSSSNVIGVSDSVVYTNPLQLNK